MNNRETLRIRISDQYRTMQRASSRLGGVLATARRGRSDASWTELLEDVGITPTEAQVFIDFAHKSISRKPLARRVLKLRKSKRY